jgi:hypothetical protein
MASDPRATQRRHGFTARLATRGHTPIEVPIAGAPSGIADGRAAMRALAPRLPSRPGVTAGAVSFGPPFERDFRLLSAEVPEEPVVGQFVGRGAGIF